ncbi:hypothetical protein SRB17_25670 [Streptomyces sp. RB17]|uniref:hypothetical protein n=1 Tax=Streptomyces sp. RB17 TaxID=2585197 RepID=UPI0012970ECC|nr:hypothetical protein [Streptomyces sp. RB17]MQY34597.1 hypothetical protein [Streptomyces sp. RB17]
MSRLIRRISIAVATTALAGGALLGAGGSASATTASQPVQHTMSSIAAFGTGSERDGNRDDGFGLGRQEERGDRWDGSRGSYRDDDRRDHYHGRHPHQTKGEERRLGHHLYAWNGNRWIEVTSWRDVSADRWYLDQLTLLKH